MAAELRQPRQHVFAAGSAMLALAAMLAGPVLAAPERDLLCDDSADWETGIDFATRVRLPSEATRQK